MGVCEVHAHENTSVQACESWCYCECVLSVCSLNFKKCLLALLRAENESRGGKSSEIIETSDIHKDEMTYWD